MVASAISCSGSNKVPVAPAIDRPVQIDAEDRSDRPGRQHCIRTPGNDQPPFVQHPDIGRHLVGKIQIVHGTKHKIPFRGALFQNVDRCAHVPQVQRSGGFVEKKEPARRSLR